MRKNILYACGAQVISFSLSVLISLVLPKYLGIEDYAYWQLFIFYGTYVGFFHFGLTDGLYLRLGGMDYQQLDYALIKTQMLILSLVQIILGGITVCAIQSGDMNIQRKEVVYFTIIYMVTGNISWFLGYIFQAVNYIDKYARAVMINKIIIIFSFLGLISCGCNSAFEYMKWYCISQTVMCIWSLFSAKEIFFSGLSNLKYTLKELKQNVLCGSSLMISNISGNLIIGATRQIIDMKWGLTAFGKISMAFSLTMFFQQFINQIGNVFFPALRRKEKNSICSFYETISFLFSAVLPLIFVFYVPLLYVMRIWLPQYEESLYYMSVLLPVCVFDGKMNVLCTTALKVFRKERKLLKINIAAMTISVVLGLAVTAIWKSIWVTMIVTVAIIVLRETYAEYYIRKFLELRTQKIQIHCLILVVIMEITILMEISYQWKFVVCIFEYLVFMLAHRTDMNKIIKICRNR